MSSESSLLMAFCKGEKWPSPAVTSTQCSSNVFQISDKQIVNDLQQICIMSKPGLVVLRVRHADTSVGMPSLAGVLMSAPIEIANLRRFGFPDNADANRTAGVNSEARSG